MKMKMKLEKASIVRILFGVGIGLAVISYIRTRRLSNGLDDFNIDEGIEDGYYVDDQSPDQNRLLTINRQIGEAMEAGDMSTWRDLTNEKRSIADRITEGDTSGLD